MPFNVCICGRVIETGARECEQCTTERESIHTEFLSGKMPIMFGDDPLHIFDGECNASQSNAQTEPIRQPNRKHTGNRRNGGK